MRARLVLPIVCASLLGCGAETTFGTDEALLGPGRDLAPWHASVTRARTTVVREDVTRGDASPRDGVELPRELRLDLFEDVSVDAALRGSRRVGRGRLWLGQVPGDPASEVSLAVVDGVYAGTVRSAGRLYQLGVTPDGEAMIVERDESQLPPEAAPEPPGPPGPTPPPSPLPGVDGDPVVDLLVVSTSAAEAGAGGPAALDAWLALAVQETNAGYAQSGVGLSLRMVHRATVSYDETGFDWSQTLGRLQGQSDGFMDEVHALRDEHGADHVMLIVDTVGPYAGIGYQLEQGFEPFFAGWAFSVVARDYAVGAYTFGHELGHNMGANHDHANASGAGYFPDSYGLQVPDHGYRTIMAYSCPGCLRINQWSNPDVMALGAPTGVVDWANNARALNATGVISAAYRPTAQAPPQDIAEMVSPEDGSAIPPSTTFVWTDAGAGAYHLTIGAEPGDTSYVDAEVGTATSYTASLPVVNELVHARLWSLTETDGWHFRDYQYTVAASGGYAATIQSPAPGSVLPGTALPFSWAATSASAYRLRVGTALQPDAYFDAKVGTATSVFVAALPDDGSEVLAELMSLGPDGWLSEVATYHAHTRPPAAAVIVFPKPSTAFQGATQWVRWTYSAEAQTHELLLRDEAGTILADLDVKTDGAVLTSVPTDGRRLFLTLRTVGDGTIGETTAAYWAAHEP